jgi:hypothetical protein
MRRAVRRAPEDWEVLHRFLPPGWREKARELGAVRRARKLDAEKLLRVLLLHLADGCSLRETAVRAKVGKLADVSDVALLKRLRHAGEWLRWLAEGLMRGCVLQRPEGVFGKLRVRLIDATTVAEPGSTGSTWRIHYAVELPALRCDEVQVTGVEAGETFRRFAVQPKDVFMGDRGYAQPQGIAHVVGAGGDVLVRMNLTNVPFLDGRGQPFDLLAHLRGLRGAAVGDWDVWVCGPEGKRIAGRLCAVRKSKEAAEKAQGRLLREARKKKRRVRPETLEAAEYVFVFTTLARSVLDSFQVLEAYRGRWQIELAFKRLKSLLALGHLMKKDPEGARAWIHGKLVVAFLIETLILAGERFFPWGYPLSSSLGEAPLCLEGD